MDGYSECCFVNFYKLYLFEFCVQSVHRFSQKSSFIFLFQNVFSNIERVGENLET
jgi:hypothetical protein